MSEGIFASQKNFHLKKIRFSTYIEKVEDTEFAHFFEDEPRWTYTPRLHHIYLKHFQGHHGRFLECKTATAVVTSPVFIHCCRRVLLYKIQARLPDKTVVLPVLPTVDFEPDIFQNLSVSSRKNLNAILKLCGPHCTTAWCAILLRLISVANCN